MEFDGWSVGNDMVEDWHLSVILAMDSKGDGSCRVFDGRVEAREDSEV